LVKLKEKKNPKPLKNTKGHKRRKKLMDIRKEKKKKAEKCFLLSL